MVPGTLADHLLKGGTYGTRRGICARRLAMSTQLLSYHSTNRWSRAMSMSSPISVRWISCGLLISQAPSSSVTKSTVVWMASSTVYRTGHEPGHDITAARVGHQAPVW